MKTIRSNLTRRSPRSLQCRSGFAALLLVGDLTALAAPSGSDFSYQGRLEGPAGPATGHYDFTFALHLGTSGGAPIVNVTNLDVAVTEGYFTTSVDFGAGIYDGTAYWLQLGVRTNGSGAFTPLSPRQALTPTARWCAA